jgi:hypothetical protein
MGKKCNYCFGDLVPKFTACKDDHVVKVYKCKVCDEIEENYYYRYNPTNCPKHHWIFAHRVFNDTPLLHTIDMVFICDRCGARHIRPQDTRRAGISGRVEIEHPLVKNTLALNKSLAKRILTKEEINDFWNDAPEALIL